MYKKLLYESESSVLDFKSEQYRFNKEISIHMKSELLKDILSFANAWKRETAYILIGVKENKEGKATVTGINSSLDDAQLQQFVNEKTQRPIDFIYKEVLLENKNIAVIEIPTQKRPVFLRKNYGKLKKNVVYIRRGSSTAEATPDEIIEMGVEDTKENHDETLIKIHEKKLPHDILNHIRLGKSLAFIKEILSSPHNISNSIDSIYNNKSIKTMVWYYSFSNAELCIESDDGESISVITLQTWGDPSVLFELPVIGVLGEITMGDVMDELMFDPQKDKLVHFRSMRDGYISLECYLGRIGMYKTYTLGCYDCFEVFKYELKNNQFVDVNGNTFDGRSIKINFISIARTEKRGHPI